MAGTTSIGAACDYLISTISGLALTSSADGHPPVYVSDGYPGTTNALDIVTVGGTIAPTEDGEQEWAALGGGGNSPLDERYDVECVISCARGGTAQKPARDAAIAIYTAIQTAIRADVTLGNAVRFCRISKFRLAQTSWEDAGKGRSCEITFAVSCEHRL